MKKFLTKNIFLMLLLSLFATGAGAQQNDASLERDWRGDRQKVRIISYNILDGFQHGQDKDRMARLTEWVKEQDPDSRSPSRWPNTDARSRQRTPSATLL